MNKTVIDQHKKLSLKHPRFGNGLVSMYVPRNLLKRNSSTLEEFSPEKYFSITKGCYSSVNSVSSNPCATTSAAVLDGISVNCHLAGTFAKHPSYCTSNSTRLQIKKTKKIRLKAVSEDLKNILSLEYLVDCSQTNNDSKQPEGNHDLEVPQDCEIPKKVGRRREMKEQIGNYPVDLTAGCHTMFVYCDLVQNEILGDTQTALLRAVQKTANVHQNSMASSDIVFNSFINHCSSK